MSQDRSFTPRHDEARKPGQVNFCPNCEGNHAWADHCGECGWSAHEPAQPRIEDRYIHEAQQRALRAKVQDGFGYASDDGARFLGRCIKQLREQVTNLEGALKSQIEITNNERAYAEQLRLKVVAQSETVAIPVDVARLIRKVFLPTNPNKCRTYHPDTLAAVRAFIATVEGK